MFYTTHAWVLIRSLLLVPHSQALKFFDVQNRWIPQPNCQESLITSEPAEHVLGHTHLPRNVHACRHCDPFPRVYCAIHEEQRLLHGGIGLDLRRKLIHSHQGSGFQYESDDTAEIWIWQKRSIASLRRSASSVFLVHRLGYDKRIEPTYQH